VPSRDRSRVPEPAVERALAAGPRRERGPHAFDLRRLDRDRGPAGFCEEQHHIGEPLDVGARDRRRSSARSQNTPSARASAMSLDAIVRASTWGQHGVQHLGGRGAAPRRTTTSTMPAVHPSECLANREDRPGSGPRSRSAEDHTPRRGGSDRSASRYAARAHAGYRAENAKSVTFGVTMPTSKNVTPPSQR
jgi:hypothetical protein